MATKNKPVTINGITVQPGERRVIELPVGKLYTHIDVNIPLQVICGKNSGPTLFISAAIHGDELNGVEITRRLLTTSALKRLRGTLIVIPVVNIFGFLDMKRAFPDGRDLNRVFPGNPRGSLASRIAYQFVKKILPIADFCMDFHTGGASRFNVAQVRIDPSDIVSTEYALIFSAPFTINSKVIPKSYRATSSRLGIPFLLFEGGKSKVSDKEIAREGVHGAIRVLAHLDMLDPAVAIPVPTEPTKRIEHTQWLRANYSGLLHVKVPCGKHVEKGEYIATITDPYGQFRYLVKASHAGYLINVNEASLVYQGDAIFNISKVKADGGSQKESEEEV